MKKDPNPPAKPSAAIYDSVVGLFGAADRLRQHLSRALAPAELTLQQYNVLRILRGAGGELPTMEIHGRMMERSPGITRIVDGLVRKGLVERVYSERDRRQVLCRLTRSGRAVLRKLQKPIDAADARAFADLGPRQLQTLNRLLRAVARELD